MALVPFQKENMPPAEAYEKAGIELHYEAHGEPAKVYYITDLEI